MPEAESAIDPNSTPYERAARVTYLLTAVGLAMTTREVMGITHLSKQGAHKLLHAISRVAPVYEDDDAIWRCSTEGG